jgi:hypothetical protein
VGDRGGSLGGIEAKPIRGAACRGKPHRLVAGSGGEPLEWIKGKQPSCQMSRKVTEAAELLGIPTKTASQLSGIILHAVEWAMQLFQVTVKNCKFYR